MKKIATKAKMVYQNIPIVDRFLMLFMLILFVYMTWHLFTGAYVDDDSNAIDIIVRTSAAAIFGYFISNNFAHEAVNDEATTNQLTTDAEVVQAATSMATMATTSAQAVNLAVDSSNQAPISPAVDPSISPAADPSSHTNTLPAAQQTVDPSSILPYAAASLPSGLPSPSPTESTLVSPGRFSKLQVYIVSIIGLSALIILLISRLYIANTPELTAIISQLRDFVSACIGFLIGCGKNGAR